MQLTMLDESTETIHNPNQSLSERIQAERLAKQPSQPFSIKQLAKMKLRFDLVIQRNVVWNDEQATKLIESSFLNYPVPPIYALRTTDKELWLLDGKQRMTKYITFLRGEWKLTKCVVYGVDVTGMTFSELPEELRELVEDQYLSVFQFEALTTDQRDQLFLRLNSGTALSSVQLVRSILGSDMLDYITTIINKPFFTLMGITDKQKKQYKDQELAMQMIGLITGELSGVSGKSIREYAFKLRMNGLTDEQKEKIECIIDYLGCAFDEFENTEKILKKNDVIGLVGAALNVYNSSDDELYNSMEPLEFGGITSIFILKNEHNYSETKRSASGSAGSIKERIRLITEALKEGITE